MACPVATHDDLPTVLSTMDKGVHSLTDYIGTMLGDATATLTEISENPARFALTTLFPSTIHRPYKDATWMLRQLFWALKHAVGMTTKQVLALPRPLTRADAMEELGLRLRSKLWRLEQALIGFGEGVRKICDAGIKMAKADREVERKVDGSKYMLDMYKKDPWYVQAVRACPASLELYQNAVMEVQKAMTELEELSAQCKSV
ncbi:hypothetical protein SLS55_010347 [Diplodia seriata]|uniref:Uncharacterized protein n=1 Tax=Diplodia seriata TaxID=420778 RepID=A0ABR3BYA2_9PEZI